MSASAGTGLGARGWRKSLILKSPRKENGVSVKKRGVGGSRIAIRSTSTSRREFGVFVRGGDYCFREETEE